MIGKRLKHMRSPSAYLHYTCPLLVASFAPFAGTEAQAAPCSANTSVAAACDDLVISASLSALDVSAAVGGGNAIHVVSGSNATVSALDINASVTGSTSALTNRSGNTITNLNINAGANMVGNWATVYNEWGATITTVTIVGTLQTSPNAGNGGLYNDNGTIGTVINRNTSGALHYAGNLASAYSLFLSGSTYSSYEFVNRYDPSNSATFTIDSTSGAVTQLVYSNIITGLTSTNFTATSGTYLGAAWSFVNTSGTNWDLVFSSLPSYGPSAADTKQSIRASQWSLGRVIEAEIDQTSQAAGMDCRDFSTRDLCLSFRLRSYAADHGSSVEGSIIAAAQGGDGVRVGTFLTHSVGATEIGGVSYAQRFPTLGAFWAYDAGANGLGPQAKLVGTLQSGSVSITRQGTSSAEPGAGVAKLDTQMLSGQVGWGLPVAGHLVATPFAGLRQSYSTRAAYAEKRSDAVDDPVTYEAYHQSTLTATLGMTLSGSLAERLAFQLGAGVEQDLHTHADDVSGRSDISDLERFAFAPGRARDGTRGFGSAGLSYQMGEDMVFTGALNFRDLVLSDRDDVSAQLGFQMTF